MITTEGMSRRPFLASIFAAGALILPATPSRAAIALVQTPFLYSGADPGVITKYLPGLDPALGTPIALGYRLTGTLTITHTLDRALSGPVNATYGHTVELLGGEAIALPGAAATVLDVNKIAAQNVPVDIAAALPRQLLVGRQRGHPSPAIQDFDVRFLTTISDTSLRIVSEHVSFSGLLTQTYRYHPAPGAAVAGPAPLGLLALSLPGLWAARRRLRRGLPA